MSAHIACSPDGQYIAIAHADNVRLFNTRHAKFVALSSEEKDSSSESPASTKRGMIRSIKFDRQSRHFMACGDDKLVRVWNCQSGKCIGKKLMPKKLSAGQWTGEASIVVADKTGDVYQLTPSWGSGAQGGDDNTQGSGKQDELECKLLLGHCATVTDLELSTKTGSKKLYLATSDVERKIRVSKWPQCYNIESFCFGHRSFVTVVDWVCFPTHDGTNIPLLLSGGGDGTVCLWEPGTGRLLDRYCKRDGVEKIVKSASTPNSPVRMEVVASASSPQASAPSPTSSQHTSANNTAGVKRTRDDTSIGSAPDMTRLPSTSEDIFVSEYPVAGLSVNKWKNLTAVWRKGQKTIEFLHVNMGSLKPHSSITVEDTPLCIAFDPQAHLWVAVLRDSKAIGVEVYGLSEDEKTMNKLEVHKTLTHEIFSKVDEKAQPLIHEYIQAHESRRARKKMRAVDHSKEKKEKGSSNNTNNNISTKTAVAVGAETPAA